jgi:hypothetical protein
VQTDVVHLDDEGDDAVDEDRDAHRHDDEDDQSREEGLVATSLSAMTMISAERMKSVRIAPATIVFSWSSHLHDGGGFFPGVVAADLLPDLLGTLEAQVGAADHEEGGERPRQELREQHDRRKDEHQFVADRPDGDPLDDRQLAVRSESLDIARGDGRVVDDDARSLDAGPPRGRSDVVDRGCRQFGDGRDVVEKRGQPTAHRCAPRPCCAGVPC